LVPLIGIFDLPTPEVALIKLAGTDAHER
jgi:hypothetical protein